MAGFQQCDFISGSVSIESLPPVSHLGEIAFAGRSNVGKSSLINALVGRKALARTSQTPGRTRQLNFFRIDGKFMLVDLPGYGYAKASKKDVYSWTELTKDYLCGRPTLRRVYLLLDVRRDNVNKDDLDWMGMFDDAAVSYQFVLTKADKAGAAHAAKRVAELEGLARKHPAAHPEVFLTSSEKGTGLKELRYAVVSAASM